ncbi:MAG: hypothetical protein GF399_02110 [Candidatus Coatesbacteria bacterium]|nr:hypothetical protein [Candidatus Coatesbacteria bacterium]
MDETEQPRRRRLILLAVCLAAVGVWLLVGGNLSDGARLQLHYADRLAAGEPWRLNPEDPSTDAAANPLLVALLALGRLVGGPVGAVVWAHLLGFIVLAGFALTLERLARQLGGHGWTALLAAAAGVLNAPALHGCLALEPTAPTALLLAVVVVGVLDRRPAVIVPATAALVFSDYAGMYAALAVCLSVPAVAVLKGEKQNRRNLWLLLPFALAVLRSLLLRRLWEVDPLTDVVVPLSSAPRLELTERLLVVGRLPLKVLGALGGGLIGLSLAALVTAAAVPRARWRLSSAVIAIALAVGGLIIRGARLILLWLSPLVVVAVVVWLAGRFDGRRRLAAAGATLVLLTVPGLLAGKPGGLPTATREFGDEVSRLLPPGTNLATPTPGLYLQNGGLRVADLSGGLPPVITEQRRELAPALERWAEDPRYRRPRYAVSEPANHDELARCPLMSMVQRFDETRALWRIDWIPLERRFGLWEPAVIEAVAGRRLLDFIDLGGDAPVLEGLAVNALGGAERTWELVLHSQTIGGREAPVADTCLVYRGADALRVDMLLPSDTGLVCARVAVSDADVEVYSESGTQSSFHELAADRWNEVVVELPPGSRYLSLIFNGLGPQTRLALGSLWLFD